MAMDINHLFGKIKKKNPALFAVSSKFIALVYTMLYSLIKGSEHNCSTILRYDNLLCCHVFSSETAISAAVCKVLSEVFKNLSTSKAPH